MYSSAEEAMLHNNQASSDHLFSHKLMHVVQARKNLEYVRGRKDVDREYNDLCEAAKLAAECKHPWKTLFSKKYRPQLILSACSTTFQQWTG